MMELKLKIVIIVVMLSLLFYMFSAIRCSKISTKNILFWIISDIFVILAVIFLDFLLKIANFIGIVNVSNMMFFLGFIFLIILCFNLSCQLSTQNKKIINLTQELGILKNSIKEGEK